MIRIGLTGSIGMGKSTVAEMFRQAGFPVFDADSIVRRLQAEDPHVIGAIGERFEGTVRDGALDRDMLSARVLGRPDELAALEAIIHPAVHSERARFVVANQDKPALLFDIPLLFETRGEAAFDKAGAGSSEGGTVDVRRASQVIAEIGKAILQDVAAKKWGGPR